MRPGETRVFFLSFHFFGTDINITFTVSNNKNMGQLSRAVEFGNEFMKDHPEHSGDVRELFQLMKDEIAEGGSVENEIDHFIGGCNDLLIEEE